MSCENQLLLRGQSATKCGCSVMIQATEQASVHGRGTTHKYSGLVLPLSL